jgi:hypothetical protein
MYRSLVKRNMMTTNISNLIPVCLQHLSYIDKQLLLSKILLSFIVVVLGVYEISVVSSRPNTWI